MKPKEPQFLHPKGDYMLNQKVSKFADKRTKRARDRSSARKKAIEASQED